MMSHYVMKQTAFENDLVYAYDGSFQGFLSTIFCIFEKHSEPEDIIALLPDRQLPIIPLCHVNSCQNKSDRVWNGLVKRTSLKNAGLFRVAFLSGEPQKEMLLWRYLKKVFTSCQDDFYQNMLDEDVWEMVQMARRVRHEAHRFQGFVRFRQTREQVFFSPIDPDHDILRLIAPFFKGHLGDQKWVVYDVKRNYGIYYDQQTLQEVVLKDPAFDLSSGRLNKEARAMDEDLYSKLWQNYYDAINIIERKNHRQMKQAMPKRYWKYLPEKNRQG
jgi:probable DNA metabolism protein